MRCLLPQPVDDVSYDALVELYDFPAAAQESRPWVRANFVSSLDGAAQGSNLRSGTLSSEADRQVFALQRALCDVILVGASTTRVEGYQPVRPDEVDTTLRRRIGLSPVPGIAVVSRSLALNPLLLQGGDAPTFVVTSRAAPPDALAAVRRVAQVVVAGDDDVDLASALDQLAGLGHRRVLTEGGPTLLSSLVAADRLDELCLTVAPLLVGGERRRITSGSDLLPNPRLRLGHLLCDGDELLARYVVVRQRPA